MVACCPACTTISRSLSVAYCGKGAPVPRGRPSEEPGGGRAAVPRSGAALINTSKAYSAMATSCEPSGSARHREATYPNPVIADDYDSPGCQIFGDLVQVGQDDR